MTSLPRRVLPIGIQSFARIRQGNHYYVDKTRFALELIAQGDCYFLSRPRRFGKSLFLDTLHELFAGRRELFTGLYAEEHWDWSVTYPVVRLDLSVGIDPSLESLDQLLHKQLSGLEEEYGLTARFPDAPSRFQDLIERLHHRLGQPLVVLVDEYDKPILDVLEVPELARQVRGRLRRLYAVIKLCAAHIRFTFLTGVSKFSKVSIFSGLNNLNDITLDLAYSAICGYTDGDIDTVFAPELPGLDREEIRRWYNGYNWGGEAVYNPFDLLLLFRKREFRTYWFETGTPTFLVNLLARERVFTPDLESLLSSEALLSKFDVDRIAPEALLFQTGYLTISSRQTGLKGQTTYRLGYPNQEVALSLNEALLSAYGVPERPLLQASETLPLLLQTTDFEGLQGLLQSLLASIPHDWYRNNAIANYEGYYASVVYSFFKATGLDLSVEDSTSQGRIDMTVRYGSHVFLFEFKLAENAAPSEALAQLKRKDYAAKYRQPGLPIWLIGIDFSRESRRIVGFEVAQDWPLAPAE